MCIITLSIAVEKEESPIYYVRYKTCVSFERDRKTRFIKANYYVEPVT